MSVYRCLCLASSFRTYKLATEDFPSSFCVCGTNCRLTFDKLWTVQTTAENIFKQHCLRVTGLLSRNILVDWMMSIFISG